MNNPVGDAVFKKTNMTKPDWEKMMSGPDSPNKAKSMAVAMSERKVLEAAALKKRLVMKAEIDSKSQREADEVSDARAKTDELKQIDDMIESFEEQCEEGLLSDINVKVTDYRSRIAICMTMRSYVVNSPTIRDGKPCARQSSAQDATVCDVPPQYMLLCGHTVCHQCLKSMTTMIDAKCSACDRSFDGIQIRENN